MHIDKKSLEEAIPLLSSALDWIDTNTKWLALHMRPDEPLDTEEDYQEAEYYREVAEEHLPVAQEDAFTKLLIVLEAVGLTELRKDVAGKLDGFKNENGLSLYFWNEEVDDVDTKPYQYLRFIINDCLRGLTRERADVASKHKYESAKRIIREIPGIIHRRELVPDREESIQGLMDEYFKVYFTDYISKPEIPDAQRRYRPDAGLKNLKLAIELKYCTNANEVSVAIAGIHQDATGYRGSLDWERFLAVFYMTEGFWSEAQIKSALRSKECKDWEVIALVGPGGRAVRRPRRQRDAAVVADQAE